MPLLTQEDIRQILERGQNEELSEAVRTEQRHQLHTRPTLKEPQGRKIAEDSKFNPAWSRFLSDLPEAILTEEKYRAFLSLVTWPLPTIPVTAAAYNELARIFEGQNRVTEFLFSAPELEQDFQDYRERLKEPQFWSTKGWEVFQNRPNAVIAIDLPALQGEELFPEPFFFVVPTERILEQKNNHKNDLIYIVFEILPSEAQKEEGIDKFIVYIDPVSWQKYEARGGDLTLLQEASHTLGYAPARNFYAEPLGDSLIRKQNPVTPNLGALDYLLFNQISRRHLDSYAAYPIYTIYEQECTYRTEDGISCQEGYLEIPYGKDGLDTKTVPCPACTGRALINPGTILQVPSLRSKEDPEMMPSAQVTPADKDSLEYAERNINTQIKEFLIHTIGFGGEPDNEQAKNEKQIASAFESRLNILMQVKEQFEQIQKFTLDTLALLRYGELYQGSIIDWGNQFFLKSLSQMQEDYALARKNGVPLFELKSQREGILLKKFQNNPSQVERARILSNLEPLEDFSLEELLKNASQFDPLKVKLKYNFTDLIQRFERTVTDVVSFMPNSNFDTKIAAIEARLLQFLKEEEELSKELTGGPESSGPPAEDNENIEEEDNEDIEQLEDEQGGSKLIN